jgi:hypothetical protein
LLDEQPNNFVVLNEVKRVLQVADLQNAKELLAAVVRIVTD